MISGYSTHSIEEEPKEDCVIIDVELNIINLQNYENT